uniref:Integrase catalytic domain-containing protein n=1 Tax=Oncorhynchus mykiss TaxID=8022 RepID=A0A8K9XER4_ONCMY
MDLVGPLPKSARGHEYILVVIDYATKFPEAIPLRNMLSKGISKELFMMFSRVGLPKTILTDQGTPFMSRLMKDLCRLYQVQQICTSIFHPQTDGLCERLNKTIKSMLRRVVSRDGKNWDMLLLHLMFALREVPQASTGFSPFELLYGRPCQGILDLAKETWETQPCPFRSTIEHIILMRDRLSAVWPIVKEHMEKAQRTQGRAYDKSATPREFTVGEKVMVLVPTAEHRLLAQWRGPYKVMKRGSPVNYLIKQPDRRKKVQLYHINLLKTYHGREEVVALMTLEGKGKEEALPQVRRGQTLLSLQPFSFHVIHRAGSRNGNADALSRRNQAGASGARPSGSVLRGKVCGRTTRGQAGLTDSSSTRHGRQGNQRQLSTADGTNDIFSFPYKREYGTSREGGESLEDGHRDRGAIHEKPLRR